MTRLSAIVATRDRPELLRDCLAALQRQEHTEFEVVVIDDGSCMPLSPVVDAAAGPVAIRYVRQDGSGLSSARNRGADVARGDVLAYLDDDAIPAPNWSRSVIEGFDVTGAAGLGGRIELLFESEAPRWLTPRLRSYLAELDLGPEALPMAGGVLPFGANCAVTREAFTSVGGFRTTLGRQGGSLLSNEEIDFFQRVRSFVGPVYYWPDAQALHRVAEGRLTRAWFHRRARSQGLSDALLEAEAGIATSRTRELVRASRTIPILAKALVQRSGPLNASVWWEYCAGRRDAQGA